METATPRNTWLYVRPIHSRRFYGQPVHVGMDGCLWVWQPGVGQVVVGRCEKHDAVYPPIRGRERT